MTSIEHLYPYLPSPWMTALERVSDNVQELRLRRDAPVTVSLPDGERYLTRDGLSRLPQSNGFYCTRRQLEACFLAFCGESVYAHQWELEQGYIAVAGGIRVGVAGTAVTRDGAVSSVQNVSSLCIRLPRRVVGCARPLLPLVQRGDTLVSTLLVGPPSCGKTTLLRDLAAQLAAHGRRVAVVDERGELSFGYGGGYDLLRGYPKAVGMGQAVRCLAPECILLDELGDGAEVQEVADCAHAGVAVVASFHGHHPEEMACRPLVRDLIRRRAFTQWVFLRGRESPGQIRDCYIPEVTPDGVDWRTIDGAGRDGDGMVRLPSSATAGDFFGDLRPSVAGVVAGDELYRPSYAGVMAAAGVG